MGGVRFKINSVAKIAQIEMPRKKESHLEYESFFCVVMGAKHRQERPGAA